MRYFRSGKVDFWSITGVLPGGDFFLENLDLIPNNGYSPSLIFLAELRNLWNLFNLRNHKILHLSLLQN